MKNIEVEVRGLLTKNKYNDLIKKFDQDGKFIREKDRVLLCYHDQKHKEIENKSIDIRLRATNGMPEIITKLGKWGGAENRKELSVMINQGDFDKMVQIFGFVGLTEGYICIRKGKIYDYMNIEFSLVEVPGHSYYFEAEKMVSHESDFGKIHQEIEKVCSSLGLKIFTDQEFYDYIKKLDNESNKVFSFEDYKEGYFQKTFNI